MPTLRSSAWEDANAVGSGMGSAFANAALQAPNIAMRKAQLAQQAYLLPWKAKALQAQAGSHEATAQWRGAETDRIKQEIEGVNMMVEGINQGDLQKVSAGASTLNKVNPQALSHMILNFRAAMDEANQTPEAKMALATGKPDFMNRIVPGNATMMSPQGVPLGSAGANIPQGAVRTMATVAGEIPQVVEGAPKPFMHNVGKDQIAVNEAGKTLATGPASAKADTDKNVISALSSVYHLAADSRNWRRLPKEVQHLVGQHIAAAEEVLKKHSGVAPIEGDAGDALKVNPAETMPHSGATNHVSPMAEAALKGPSQADINAAKSGISTIDKLLGGQKQPIMQGTGTQNDPFRINDESQKAQVPVGSFYYQKLPDGRIGLYQKE